MTKTKAKNKVAFVTYNTLEGVSSGWNGSNRHQALVLQNTKGLGSRETGQMNANQRQSEIDQLWQELQQNLTKLDHVVIYVGSMGSERAIALAAQLPAEKVTFVGCSCGLPIKEALIQAAGLGKAGRMLCECGGHRTMKALIQSFVETGKVASC